MKKLLVPLVALLATVMPAHAHEVDSDYDSGRTALAVVHPDGSWTGSEESRESRAALSLAKLYLGYWVLYHGTEEDKELVGDMIAVSDDVYAGRLDSKYPQAIGEIAEDFELEDTARNGAWGKTSTSAYDVASFVAAILWDPVAKPLLDGMREKEDTARDGFRQDFGAARLNRVEGFKTGWSDDGEAATGSVAFGQTGDEVWVVAALTTGDSKANTEDVEEGINQIPQGQSDFWELAQTYPVAFTALAMR